MTPLAAMLAQGEAHPRFVGQPLGLPPTLPLNWPGEVANSRPGLFIQIAADDRLRRRGIAPTRCRAVQLRSHVPCEVVMRFSGLAESSPRWPAPPFRRHDRHNPERTEP